MKPWEVSCNGGGALASSASTTRSDGRCAAVGWVGITIWRDPCAGEGEREADTLGPHVRVLNPPHMHLQPNKKPRTTPTP